MVGFPSDALTFSHRNSDISGIQHSYTLKNIFGSKQKKGNSTGELLHLKVECQGYRGWQTCNSNVHRKENCNEEHIQQIGVYVL